MCNLYRVNAFDLEPPDLQAFVLSKLHTDCCKNAQQRSTDPGRQKTDANDAVGIYIACQQPNMTFCQVKSIEQLNIQPIESSRKFIKKTLSSTSNHIIALFYEYGIAFGKDKKALKAAIARHLAPVSDTFPSPVKQTLSLLWQQYKDTATQLDNLEKQLATQVKPSFRSNFKNKFVRKSLPISV